MIPDFSKVKKYFIKEKNGDSWYCYLEKNSKLYNMIKKNKNILIIKEA